MSKQYLTIHTLDAAHPTDIFSLAPTPTSLLSASGSSSLLAHSTTDPSFPVLQKISGAHKLGTHHVSASASGRRAVSAGFGGEVRVWRYSVSGSAGDGGGEGRWEEDGVLERKSGKEGEEVWAVGMGAAGRYVATSGSEGGVGVWDLGEEEAEGGNGGGEGFRKVREYETKGSFGVCVAMSPDSRLTASGHENGSIYIFNNDSGRLLHSLSGLIRPVRAVAFSPLSKLLAAAGDSRVIALYDVSSGECVANLAGHAAWVMSLDFNHSGEYLLSGAFDGKIKVWRIETRTCVATHGESEKCLWSVKWLPKAAGMRSEMFVAAGKGGGIAFYREASGG